MFSGGNCRGLLCKELEAGANTGEGGGGLEGGLAEKA